MIRLLLLAPLLLAASATPAAQPAPTARSSVTAADIAKGNRDFGVSLYQRLAATPGNVFISPVSIGAAFGPVAAGARADTRTAVGKVLRFPSDDAALHSSLGGMLNALKSDKDGASVSIANAMWLMKDFTVKSDFIATAKQHYGAEVDTLDFTNSPASAGRINAWVSRETKKRIPKLFEDNAFDENTRVVVTNAVHFLGDWEEPFSARATSPHPFYLSDGKTKQAPLMFGTQSQRYVEAGPVEMVELPYKGDRLSMVVILPKARDGLPVVESMLAPKQLDDWLDKLDAAETQSLNVILPKVQMEGSYNLVEPLKRLGMGIAFDRYRSDFTGIAGGPRLFISDVVHKTFLRIDEKGTEAAAATGVTISAESSGPELTFRADHPFLALIRDKQTGAVLFLGRIVDP
jgi:serpin B